MKKLLLIILLLLLFLIIFNFKNIKSNSEGFFNNHNYDIFNIGINNLNNYTPLVCNAQASLGSSNPQTIQVNGDNYSNCFTDENSNKYIEVDKQNNICTTYEDVSCQDNNDGGINTNMNSNKILFKKKSRELLLNEIELQQTTQATTQSTTQAVQTIVRLNIYIDHLYDNPNHFKGVDTNLVFDLFRHINDSNHINVNDYFCCLAEHLYIARLVPTQSSLTSNSINHKINSLNINNLLSNIFTTLQNSNFNITNIYEYYKKLQDRNNSHYLLCYNIQVLKVLMLLHFVKIIKLSNYFRKYNSSYITYLFYSFKRGEKLWGEFFTQTINNLQLSAEIKQILRTFMVAKFFENPNNENIYKLFIYTSALNNNTHLKYVNDTSNTENNGSVVVHNDPILTYSNNKITPINTLHKNLYVFYYNDEVVDNNKICSTAENEQECSELSSYGCEYDTDNNRCRGEYSFRNCMQYTDENVCNSFDRCEYNTQKNVCLPKNCVTSNNGSITCNRNYPHCENLTNVQVGDHQWNQCYDNVRIVKGANHPINDSFYDKNLNINDRCVNKLYNSNGERLSDENIPNNCNEGCSLSSHNETNTCVRNSSINENEFFDARYCNNLDTEFICDLTPNCFWGGNKCYPNSSGNDSMVCRDFTSEERCPINKCIWYNNRCNNIYNNENNNELSEQLQTQSQESQTQPSTNFEIGGVNCLAINNDESNTIEKRNECIYNNCDWNAERNLCVDKINKGCLLKDENTCTNLQTNFNPTINRNMCKMITDRSVENGKNICVDNELKIPCKFFTKDDCPTTENPIVNLQGEITEEPYCKLSIDRTRCIEKHNNEESCLYNYLKDGTKVNNYSRNCNEIEIQLTNEDGSTRQVNTSVENENLPCSLLDNNNCTYRNNGNRCNLSNNRCKTNKDKLLLFSRIDDILDNNSLSNYDEILNRIGNIYRKQKHNRLCRYEDQIHGNITNVNNNEIYTSIDITNISTLNNFIIFFVHLQFDDLMNILGIDESSLTQSQKRNYEHFLDNLNVLIKKKMELSHILDVDTNKNLWISKKYKLTNKDSNSRMLVINEKLYFKIDNSPISTNYGSMIIDEIPTVNITGTGMNRIVRIPYYKLIKWFIPNPMANLTDCLDDLKLKNLDKERYFNI